MTKLFNTIKCLVWISWVNKTSKPYSSM